MKAKIKIIAQPEVKANDHITVECSKGNKQIILEILVITGL